MADFPNTKFYITSNSKDTLKSFREHFKEQKSYFSHFLDVQKGVSLHDFTYYYGKFDLVIANKIYSKIKRRKRYLSIKFLYKHYLQQNGLLCLIDYVQDSKKEKYNLLKYIEPAKIKSIPIKKKDYSIQFIFYRNNKKFV
jgi:hypothetical protein